MSGARALTGLAALIAAAQSEDADASLAKLAERGIRVAQKINNPDLNDMEFSLLSPEGVSMGGARVMDPDFSGVLRADQMELYPEHRGQGLMDMLYDAIEEMTGSPMAPSNYLTPDGAKFWARRDPLQLQERMDNGDFDWDWHETGRAVEKALEDSLLGTK